MRETEIVSIGFRAVLREQAAAQIENLLELMAGDEDYARAVEEQRATEKALTGAGRTEEVREAYLNLEAANNYREYLELVTMYRQGFEDGLRTGLKARENRGRHQAR